MNSAPVLETSVKDLSEAKCHFCSLCDGRGCIGEMPGMGGAMESRNFLLNCSAWNLIQVPSLEDTELPPVKLAPMTGAVENVGFPDEHDFYQTLVKTALASKAGICIGDGTPDEKLLFGIEALKKNKTKGAVFIKPYPNEKIIERSLWAEEEAELFGVDIDAYNIITMRNKVSLEKKDSAHLKELKRYWNARGFPFAIKGIFTSADLELVKEVKPDIAYISNHGGRVPTLTGSTASFLKEYAKEIKKNTHSLWVDGGIRNASHAKKARALGADCVLLGRPFATATLLEKTIDLTKSFSFI